MPPAAPFSCCAKKRGEKKALFCRGRFASRFARLTGAVVGGGLEVAVVWGNHRGLY